MSWSLEQYYKLKNTGNLIIVGGTHGAGKSTLCKELKSLLKWDYLSPQEIENKYDCPIAKRNVYKLLLNRAREKIASGESFIFEHIMSGNFVEKLLNESQLVGFKCHLLYLDVEDANLALKRVAIRVKSGGHDVELKNIYEKLNESRLNFWKKYKGMGDSWVIFDNSIDYRRIISHSGLGSDFKVILEKEHSSFVLKASNGFL